MNLYAILLTGLFAGGVSCSAVQGGLLTGLVARQHKATVPAQRSEVGWHTKLADDLAPVGGFLAGKLVSHTILGALLGGVGTAVELSPHARAFAQLAAGALIVCFGLAQLEVPGFKGFVINPPASWLRLVRGRARSQAALAPAALGFATILVPCGVTLSVMALALTSGSPINGAATMAVFVIGTSPMFTLIGYAANKAVTTWKHRLAVATGVILLAMGAYTFNGGLTIMGSPFAAKNLAATVGAKQAPAEATSVATTKNGIQTAVITVTPGQFSPNNVLVTAGVPTKLVFRAEGAAGCIRALVIPSLGSQTILPENGDTVVDLGTPKAGTINYACGMGMYTGQITVKAKAS